MLNVWGGHGCLKRGHWNKEGTHFVYDGRGGDLFHIPRKKYTRKRPYPATTTHFSALPREKAAIIKLRNFGYPIQHLATALGRSTSFIHRTLKEARLMGALNDRVFDKRKCPRMALLLGSRRKLNSLLSRLSMWTLWILGAEEEPP